MKTINLKLSVLTFLQFISYGIFYPIMSYYMLKYLHFSPYQVGLALAVSSASNFISPFVVGMLSDKILSSERLIFICNILAAIFILITAFQTDFILFTIFFFLYTLVMMPTNALLNTIIFHNLGDNAEKDFGNIRLWGTIGWIVPSWFVSVVLISPNISIIKLDLSIIFPIIFISSILVSVFVMIFFKEIKIMKKEKTKINFSDFFSPFRIKGIVFIIILNTFINMIDRFHFYGTSPFLVKLGFLEKDVMALMSIGQFLEIFIALTLSFLLMKLKMKNVIILGILIEALRYGLYCFTTNKILITIALALHGIISVYYYFAIMIELDKYCDYKNRSNVQQLNALFTSGIGTILGNYISGFIGEIYYDKTSNTILFEYFWLVPFIISVVVLIIVIIFFKRYDKKPRIEIVYNKMEI